MLSGRSKYYISEESWTRCPAWAFEIPLAAVEADCGDVELRCSKPDGEDYYRLIVPLHYFKGHLGQLYRREDHQTVSIFLLAEAGRTFIDQRGSGKLAFGQFFVP